jgi:hypothetical protein
MFICAGKHLSWSQITDVERSTTRAQHSQLHQTRSDIPIRLHHRTRFSAKCAACTVAPFCFPRFITPAVSSQDHGAKIREVPERASPLISVGWPLPSDRLILGLTSFSPVGLSLDCNEGARSRNSINSPIETSICPPFPSILLFQTSAIDLLSPTFASAPSFDLGHRAREARG